MSTQQPAPRLSHDTKALFRSWQMSSAKMIAIIEGDTDTPFYSALCESALDPNSYILIPTKLLPTANGVGGKGLAIKFLETAEKEFGLINNGFGKKTGLVFLLDKDIDDVLGLKISSQHVIYTEPYDFEGYVIEHSNFFKALSIALNASERTIKSHVPSHSAWLKTSAEAWLDWITLCIYCQSQNIKSEPNYSCYSKINDNFTGKINPAEYGKIIQKIATKSGKTEPTVKVELSAIKKSVEDLFVKNKQREVFKGKWYKIFIETLEQDVLKKKSNSTYDKFMCSAMATLDFNEPWTAPLKTPLLSLYKKL